jgi:hypothetical protein
MLHVPVLQKLTGWYSLNTHYTEYLLPLYGSSHSGQHYCSPATHDAACAMFSAAKGELCINNIALNTLLSYFPTWPMLNYERKLDLKEMDASKIGTFLLLSVAL